MVRGMVDVGLWREHRLEVARGVGTARAVGGRPDGCGRWFGA